MAEVDVAEGKFVVLEAGSDELLDAVQFHAVAPHVQTLETCVLKQTFADGKHDFFADSTVSQGEVSQVFAAAEHRDDRPGQLKVCRTASFLRDLKVIVIENQTADRHTAVV